MSEQSGASPTATTTTSLDYSKPVTPDHYKCADCGATGVRLWREFRSLDIRLLCATCAEDDQRKLYETGWRSPFSQGIDGDDTIGVCVPAVPDKEGIRYHTTPSPAAYDWWENLPTCL